MRGSDERKGAQWPHAVTLGADGAYDAADFADELVGGMKTIGGMRRPMLRGPDRVGWATFMAAAYDLVGLPKLLAVSP